MRCAEGWITGRIGERVIGAMAGALLTLAWRKHVVMGLETVTVVFFFFSFTVLMEIDVYVV